MIFKTAAVLALLPRVDCQERDRVVNRDVAEKVIRRTVHVSCILVEQLSYHNKTCACIGGIDMWLKQV